MSQQVTFVDEQTLRRILRTAATESMREAQRHCSKLLKGTNGARELEHDEALAWIAARASEEAWSLLPSQDPDTMAPLAWAIQEIVEWASHVGRLECVGDIECRAPITWLPQGDHPLGSRNLNRAVEERLDLLRTEMREHHLIVRADNAAEVAA